MSPRIIHIPLSGGDRKAQAKGVRQAHGLHAAYYRESVLIRSAAEAKIREADRLECEAWNAIMRAGGAAVPSPGDPQGEPTIGKAINGGFDLWKRGAIVAAAFRWSLCGRSRPRWIHRSGSSRPRCIANPAAKASPTPARSAHDIGLTYAPHDPSPRENRAARGMTRRACGTIPALAIYWAEHRHMRGDTLQTALSVRPRTPELRAVFYLCARKSQLKMNEVPEFVSAMLAIVFAAVMLVAEQLYIENSSARLPFVTASLMASVPPE
jgi:hypothetical protein